MVLINCKQCNKEINREQKNINRSKNNFCSRKCAGIFSRNTGMIKGNESEEVASDIIEHINKHKLHYWSTRFQIKKGVYCKKTDNNYTNTHVLASGVLHLSRISKFKKISQRRYEISE